jgi:hypothetical protein
MSSDEKILRLKDIPKNKAIPIKLEKCSFCGGRGSKLVLRGLDLRAWREKHKVSLNQFSIRAQMPEKSESGVSVSYTSRVELGHDPCPLWLYLEYLKIPQKTYPQAQPFVVRKVSREAAAKASAEMAGGKPRAKRRKAQGAAA